MGWTIPKSEVADLLRLNVLARLQEAREKLRLFEDAYHQPFEEFERVVRQQEEDFQRWDDYVEWKAYRRLQRELQEKIAALDRGDFEVA